MAVLSRLLTRPPGPTTSRISGEHVAIRLDWEKGLSAYTINGASALGTIGNRGSAGLVVSGSGQAVTSFYNDNWTVVGLAGDEIEVDARFRHAIAFEIGSGGTADITPGGTGISGADTLIVNEADTPAFHFDPSYDCRK